MLILGIETSCDETAASLVEIIGGKIKVLSNVVSSQVKLHAKYGGVVPSLAAREHVKNLPRVLNLALRPQNIKYKIQDTDLIAVTAGPGLISSLLVGTAFAKTLAWKFKKPVVGVNHVEGHIASNWLLPVAGSQKLKVKSQSEKLNLNGKQVFPAMCLVVSGGHTQLILMSDFGKYKIVGETLDDAAGEAFDKIARILELGYPGGPAIAAEAARIENRESRIEVRLPRPMMNSGKFDFSFSGLKTAVLYLDRDLKKKLGKNKLPKELIPEIAAEAQRAIVDVLVSKTIKAAGRFRVKSVMLSGGVSANDFLRSELKEKSKKEELKFFCPASEYTTDNAVMTALAGYFAYKNKNLRRETGRWQTVKANANLII